MKEEIKESINRIQSIVDFYKLNDENNYDYSDDVLISMKTLLDYITNLQEENERLNLELSGYRQAILNDDKLLGLKSRIDKAIEYINNKWKKDKYYEDIENCMTFCEYDKEDLLNILQGEDTNVKDKR